MDKNVATLLFFDETIALSVIKPFYSSLWQNLPLLSSIRLMFKTFDKSRRLNG